MFSYTDKSMIIPWGQLNRGSFLYGAEITYFSDSRIYYKQPYLPVGTIIHTWFSETNHQADRDVPHLPILHRRKKYQINLNIASVDGYHPYLRITVKNRRQEIVSYQIIKGDKGQFIYPQEAYTYQIELINAGCREFLFDSLLLTEIDDEPNDDLPFYSHLISNSNETNKLAILFLEPTKDLNEILLDNLQKSFPNIVILGDYCFNEAAYLRSDYLKFAHKMIQDSLSKTHTNNLFFIGYEQVSNRAASFYSSLYKDSETLVSQSPEKLTIQIPDDLRQDYSDYYSYEDHQMVESLQNEYTHKQSRSVHFLVDKMYQHIFNLEELITNMK